MIKAVKDLEIVLDATPDEIVDCFAKNDMITKQEAQAILIGCSYELDD
jgi:hypothetical protein